MTQLEARLRGTEHDARLLARRRPDGCGVRRRGLLQDGRCRLAFFDPQDPSKGFAFEGRLSEDFKLSTGTWVRVGPLRQRFLAHFGDIVQDVVIAGHERDEVTALAFPAIGACRALCGPDAEVLSVRELFERDVVRAAFCERLTSFAQVNTGHSTRVVAPDPARGPSVDRRSGNYGQGVGQSEIRPDQSRRAGRAALRRRRSGNRHQSRHGRARRSGAGRRGPRERRRWGVRRGEAPG